MLNFTVKSSLERLQKKIKKYLSLNDLQPPLWRQKKIKFKRERERAERRNAETRM